MSYSTRGSQRENHKYIRREWRNGRWVYFYDNELGSNEYPKGQNYKTYEQREQERKEAAAQAAAEKARAEEKQRKKDEAVNTFAKVTYEIISRGQRALERISDFLSTPVIETFRRHDD